MRRATRPSVAALRAHERARWHEATLGASRARPQPPRRRSTRCCVVLAVFLLAGCSVLSVDLRPRIRPLEEHTVAGQGTAKLLLLDLSGVLADDQPGLSLTQEPPHVPLLARVQEELRKAQQDAHVKALIVRINSPGGTITASDTLYREIAEFKRRRQLPVIAAIMDVGASGGYYAALAADTIVAHPTAITGSIGVVMLTVNAQGLLEKIGVAPLAITSGAMKDAGSPFRALRAEERAVFQGVIDAMYERFVTRIVQSRKLPEARVRGFADGRIYTAEQALALGLVDHVAYLDEVVEMAKKAAGVEAARVIMYHRPEEYRASLYAGVTPTLSSAVTALAQVTGMLVGAGPRFMYLWWP
jgi:protease IV